MGMGLDWGGFCFELIPSADMNEILRAFPRLNMRDKFAAAVDVERLNAVDESSDRISRNSEGRPSCCSPIIGARS